MQQHFRHDIFQAFEGGYPPAWYSEAEEKKDEERRQLLLHVSPYNQIIEHALHANPASFDEEILRFDEQRGFPNRPRRV